MPMTINQFRQLAAYNRWANARLYAAALGIFKASHGRLEIRRIKRKNAETGLMLVLRIFLTCCFAN